MIRLIWFIFLLFVPICWSSEYFDRGCIFELTEQEQGVNPVKNEGFEEIENRLPSQWNVENEELISITDGFAGSSAVSMRLEPGKAGYIWQLCDISRYKGKKLFLRFRTKVVGSAIPVFSVELIDGRTVTVPGKGGNIETNVLTKLNEFGWYPYDGAYGWLWWNHHYSMLYNDSWQTVGGVFTVPEDANVIKLIFFPEAAKYNAIERRKQLFGFGCIFIDAIEIGQTKESLAQDKIKDASQKWADFNYSPDEFFYLSYVYNQKMIEKANIENSFWRLYSALEQCRKFDLNVSVCFQQIPSIKNQIDGLYIELSGMRKFYESNCQEWLKKIDLINLMNSYSIGDGADGIGLSSINDKTKYLSLYIEQMVNSNFKTKNICIDKLNLEMEQTKKQINDLMSAFIEIRKTIWSEKNNIFKYESPNLSYEQIGFGKRSENTPIFFATGNTGFPYRIYKDLGVDIVSINYYASSLIDENLNIRTHPILDEVLQKQGQKQYDAMFFPAHYHFAVPNSYIEKNLGTIADILRVDKNGNSPIRTRDKKFDRYSQDKFSYDPNYTYYLPVSIMNPQGRQFINDRVEGIARFLKEPMNKRTIARLELGAESVNLLCPEYDQWTKEAYNQYLSERFGSADNAAAKLCADIKDLNELSYWNMESYPEKLQVQIGRLKMDFLNEYECRFYEEMLGRLHKAVPELPMSNRENALWFTDHCYMRAKRTTDLIDYHAMYDRAYGYYLGKFVDEDHLTSEDLISAQSGLKSRDTAELASVKLLSKAWRQAQWDTKSISIWNLYAAPYYIGAASSESSFSMINENWAGLTHLKNDLRRFQNILNGQVAEPKTVIFQCEQQGYAGWYMPSVYSTVSYLKNRNIDYGYAFEAAIREEKDTLDNYKLIFLPPALFINEELQHKFLQWVNSGGILVTFGPFGIYDEYVNKSQLFMNTVFGKASYHLIGDHESVKNYDGLCLTIFEKCNRGVKELGIDPVRPLSTDDVWEKCYNDIKRIRRFELKDEYKKHFREKIIFTDYGKGRVIMIPREFLANQYSLAMDTLIVPIGCLAKAWTQESGFEIITRYNMNRKKDKGTYVFVQNTNQWQGPRTALVSVAGTYSHATEIGVPGCMPLKLEKLKDVCQFEILMAPGQLAVVKLECDN